MGIKSFFKNMFQNNVSQRDFERLTESKPFKQGFLSKMIKKIGYSLDQDFREYKKPDFDLYEISKAYDTDSYVRQAIDKYTELIFKQGWDISYRDRKINDYLTRRLVMISDQMGEPFDHFLKNIADDLVKYHNIFIAKKRKKQDNQPYMPGVDINPVGRNRYPVATYRRIPPQTMRIKTDEHGTVKMYKQVVNGKEHKFNPKDMIHIAYKRPSGKMFGVPFLMAALDDVRLLRNMEDNVAKLLYRHLYPLFIYSIGGEELESQPEDEEISDMQQKIKNMPVDGGLVIPGRHNIDLLTSEEKVNAEDYLKYFEKRVFTGLGVSETLMGRSATSNRSTAENQSAEMRDKVKAFQSVLESYMNHTIFRELLMEAGFDPILNKKDQARFSFNEIDIDLLIKRENHAIYKYEHNAHTHEEMREELNKEPVSSEEEQRLNGNMFNDEIEDETDDARSEDEGGNNYSEYLNEDKIYSITAELETAVQDIFRSYSKQNDQGKEELKSVLNETFNLYSDKIMFYIKNDFKKNFNLGEKYSKKINHLEVDTNNKIDSSILNRLDTEYVKVRAKSLSMMEKILSFNNITESKIQGRVEHIESLLVSYYRSSISYAFSVGQYTLLKENGYKPIDKSTNEIVESIDDINKYTEFHITV